LFVNLVSSERRKRGKLHPLELFADVAWETYCPAKIVSGGQTGAD
jgi:hypothetical protein